jgi:hypothetical protein
VRGKGMRLKLKIFILIILPITILSLSILEVSGYLNSETGFILVILCGISGLLVNRFDRREKDKK